MSEKYLDLVQAPEVALSTSIRWKLNNGMCAHDGYLKGLLFTILDAITVSDTQKKALKDLVNNALTQAHGNRHDWIEALCEDIGYYTGDEEGSAIQGIRGVCGSSVGIWNEQPNLDEVSYKYTRSEK